MAARGNRDQIVVATKVGKRPGSRASRRRRSAAPPRPRCAGCGTDRIDLYYAHMDDADTPLEETLGAFDELVREGKVRHIAASNYTAPRLAEALRSGDAATACRRYVAPQPHYNLITASEYEGALGRAVRRARAWPCVPYFALAQRLPHRQVPDRRRRLRGRRAPARRRGYLDERGLAVLAALDELAAAHATTVAAVALAWLAAQPTVAAPIASARTPEQLADLLPMGELQLTADELGRLTAASA